MRSKFIFPGVLLSLSLAGSAQAKRFENAYVSFQLPDEWTCALEDTEWVCQPPAGENGKISMIVILAAKLVGNQDSPQLYLRHLEQVGQSPDVVVAHAPEERLIGRAIWLDATFQNSEIKNYETRYLARTEGRVGILITFSAHVAVVESARSISDAVANSVEVNSRYVRPELNVPIPR